MSEKPTHSYEEPDPLRREAEDAARIFSSHYLLRTPGGRMLGQEESVAVLSAELRRLLEDVVRECASDIAHLSPRAAAKILSIRGLSPESAPEQGEVMEYGDPLDTLAAEVADLAAGFPPRPWRCPCGAVHARGHVGAIGVHRCLKCGYMGSGGEMLPPESAPEQGGKP